MECHLVPPRAGPTIVNIILSPAKRGPVTFSRFLFTISPISARSAVKYRFVDIRRVEGLPSVYFATQLTVGPVGGRYLISKMTFDKGGVWQKIKGPDKDKYSRVCRYVSIVVLLIFKVTMKQRRF